MNASEKRLQGYAQVFAEGQRGALLDALAECARSGVAMPQWLADEWLRIYGEILTGRKIDLNEALGFGLTDPRTRHRRYIVATRAAEVGNAILRARAAGQAVDDELKQAVAEELGLTLRQVRQCWDACRDEAQRFGFSIDDLDPGAFSGLMRGRT